MRTIVIATILVVVCSLAVQAQAVGPWSMLLPDPDDMDWSSNNRPGYRYRGMEPVHQRFHDYIEAKRARGEELSMGDNAMIRRLQAARRWPEAPVPNHFWREFLRYLRAQPSLDLNFAQGFMFAEAVARGLIPIDMPANESIRKASEFLNSGPFRARNWFERCFGRIEQWMDYHIAQSGVDMTAGSAPSGVFPPGGDFNGLRINYNITGVNLGEPKDTEGFVTKREYTGAVGPGTVTISGSGSIDKGWGATLEIYLRIGSQRIEEEFTFDSPGSKDFSYTVQVPPNTDFTFPPPQLWIKLTGRYSTAGAGSAQVSRGLLVAARLQGDPNAVAAQRERADAEWRAEVERTLRELGYEQTTAGREAEEMRQALEGGDAAWRDYVNRKQRELGYRETEVEREFDELDAALNADEQTWQRYVATHGGGTPPVGTAPPIPAPPATHPSTPPPATGDIGGLQVGTGSDAGNTTGAADHFPQASRVAAALTYENQQPGSVAIAVWTRDGAEVTRSQQPLAGANGWASFSLSTQDPGGLQPGRYTLTITVGNTILGRKTFTIGPGQGAG